ncbi:MFS general substrate transporter [Agrocybe pediades]|nr:MFS general substrate transporter [Agrocybe pediades]
MNEGLELKERECDSLDIEDTQRSPEATTFRVSLGFDAPIVSSLPDIHSSEQEKVIIVERQRKISFTRSCHEIRSPCPSSPSTAVNSRAPSPVRNYDDINSAHNRRLMKWRLASGFFALFVGGWADGVTGTVMPYLVSQFNLTSVLSSSLFAATTCGYFAGTLSIEILIKLLGKFHLYDTGNFWLISKFLSKQSHPAPYRGHSNLKARYLLLVFASVVHATYFIMMGSRAGYPVIFMAYVFSAFSRALLTAPLNLYFASGPKQALGFGFGLASLGSVVSPLVCQTIIATGVPWYRFYYGSLVLSGINILFLAVSFRPTEKEMALERRQDSAETVVEDNVRVAVERSAADEEKECGSPRYSVPLRIHRHTRQGAIRRLASMPYQWSISLFILLYCGSETTTQGFMVSYLLNTKGAHPKTVGYVTSGFWAGISLGRFIWGACIPSFSFAQRKYIVHACIGVSVAVHLTIWLVNSYVENAIATGMIGVLYGPVFPACLTMATDILPAEVLMVSMALISSFASLGGAIFPLVAGVIFDARGIKTLTYVTVPLAAAMACLWTLFPSRLPAQSQSNLA